MNTLFRADPQYCSKSDETAVQTFQTITSFVRHCIGEIQHIDAYIIMRLWYRRYWFQPW